MVKEKLKYDLLVIGSGAAGFYAAREAARAGLKTAVVEKKEFGGTAFYWGSLPVKMIADKIKAYQKAEGLFSNFKSKPKIEDFLLQASDFNKIETKVKKDLTQAGADIFYGEGHFNSAQEFELADKIIEAEQMMLATGSKVKTASNFNLDGKYIISHKEAVTLKELPESILIVGMNIEGAEFASIFSFLGVKVYILDQEDSLLPGIDQDLTEQLQRELEKNGVELMPSTLLKNAEITENEAKKMIRAELESASKNGKNKSLVIDKILFTAGREVNFPAGIENLELDFKGHQLIVNQKLQTSEPNIYALGDLNSRFGIASTAINDALIAVNDLKQKEVFKNKLNSDQQAPTWELKSAAEQIIPLNIFTIPEIGGLGLSETQLKAKNIEYQLQKYYFKDCWRSLNSGDQGFVKIMLAADGEQVLGIYLVGNELSEIISSLSLAGQDLQLKELLENIYVHPTRSEILREAALLQFPGVKALSRN
jgi:dihydrolipoamide dehydrogenase